MNFDTLRSKLTYERFELHWFFRPNSSIKYSGYLGESLCSCILSLVLEYKIHHFNFDMNRAKNNFSSNDENAIEYKSQNSLLDDVNFFF